MRKTVNKGFLKSGKERNIVKQFLSNPVQESQTDKETRHWKPSGGEGNIANTECNFWKYYKNKQMIMAKHSYGN